MIFDAQFKSMLQACQQMLNHKQTFAKPTITQHTLDHIGLHTTNAQLLTHLVAESILKRIDRQLMESKNIYVENFDIPQIVMFYKMAQAYPHIFLSHGVANQCLANAMKGFKSVTLFEIGVGKALQIKDLLQLVAQQCPELEHFKVIALDPDSSNLEDSRQILEAIEGLPFTLKYIPRLGYIETFSVDDFLALKEIAGPHVFVNSSYTLHHINHPVGDTQLRTSVLAKIKALDPQLITLIEPNANHDTENLAQRFKQAWQHFGPVFELIDESDLDAETRFSIKEKFFGREIRDIFGVADHFRCERHEPLESWMLRLTRAGFEPSPIQHIEGTLPKHSKMDVSDGIVRLSYNDLTLIAIFAYRPVRP